MPPLDFQFNQIIKALYLDLPSTVASVRCFLSQSGWGTSPPLLTPQSVKRIARCPKTVNTPLTFSHTVVPLSLPVSEIAQGDWTRGRETWDQYVPFAKQMDHTVTKVLSSAQLWMRPWEVVPTRGCTYFIRLSGRDSCINAPSPYDTIELDLRCWTLEQYIEVHDYYETI